LNEGINGEKNEKNGKKGKNDKVNICFSAVKKVNTASRTEGR
jgi:hypothetical protein